MKTDSLVLSIIEKINSQMSDIENVEAVLSHSGEKIRAPIQKIYLAFLTTGNNVSYFSDENEECCCRNKIEIQMNCYASFTESAESVIAKAETVLTRLCGLFAGEMIGFDLGKAVRDDDAKALKISCKLFFRYETCPAYETESSVLKPFADFFCKTHALNEEIHLTEKEKQFVRTPFAMGTYIGNGQKTRDICLEFSPRLLLVFAASLPPVIVSEQGKVCCRYGFSCTEGASRGLLALSNGFRITTSASTLFEGSLIELNNALQKYVYVALR